MAGGQRGHEASTSVQHVKVLSIGVLVSGLQQKISNTQHYRKNNVQYYLIHLHTPMTTQTEL